MILGSFVLYVNYNLSVKEKPTAKLCCNGKMKKASCVHLKPSLYTFCRHLNKQICYFCIKMVLKFCSTVTAH